MNGHVLPRLEKIDGPCGPWMWFDASRLLMLSMVAADGLKSLIVCAFVSASLPLALLSTIPLFSFRSL